MKNKSVKTMIVLGSGGHTAEMLEVVKNLNKLKYTPRCYVSANTDKTSKNKIKLFEDNCTEGTSEFFEINRSREVKQSYVTSIITTLIAILSSIPLVYNIQPNLILCNGPGTCVPICLVAFFFRLLHLIPKNCKIVFLESYCRVKTLSMSGKLLKYFVDMFVIQWPQLQSRTTKYFGKLM